LITSHPFSDLFFLQYFLIDKLALQALHVKVFPVQQAPNLPPPEHPAYFGSLAQKSSIDIFSLQALHLAKSLSQQKLSLQPVHEQS